MKLKTLFESPKILNKVLGQKIIDDCKPFIHEVIDIDEYRLYRGIQTSSLGFATRSSAIADGVYSIKVRKDRTPLNVAEHLHKGIDEWMEKHLGNKFRSESIFCIGNSTSPLAYGSPFVILPIGKFSYAWSPFIEDLFSDVDEINNESAETPEEQKENVEKVKNILAEADYRTSDLMHALTEYKTHEIMVHCDSYYAFEETTFNNYFYPLYRMLT